tara:strand:- start:1869 stop:4415 length:2547 start_codon:yes stop_codon:yes gene_type:complete
MKTKTKSKAKNSNKNGTPVAPKKSVSADPFKFNTEGSIDGMKQSILNHLKLTLARDTKTAQRRDWWLSACYAVRDRVLEQFIKTQEVHNEANTRRLYYLSLEYLMGRLLTNNLYNMGIMDLMKDTLEELGLDYECLDEEEVDMGLGNGGLGRLAACFLDSLATLDYPAVGYGIYYEFGLFQQGFSKEGHQVERPDNWRQSGNPWFLVRPEYRQDIHLYGRVVNQYDQCGDWCPVWVDTKIICGVPHDMPIVGYGGKTVNFLRLWESCASEEFDLKTFNEGGYVEAVREKAIGETISKVLYPNDQTESGKELRLVQQYFFVSCSLKDIIRRYLGGNKGWDAFPEKVSVQLNDTHPTLAVVELMRILIDEQKLNWEKAWSICEKVFAYTNHTLLPEALERWSVSLIEKVLPRHLQIIYEINRRFLKDVVEAKWPGDDEKKRALSIIEDGETPMVRMAHLATIASHSINGVAALHTELLKSSLFYDFNELYPQRFNNKTNGVTPRRWLRACNPKLSELIDSKIGGDWTVDLDELRKLEKFADDEKFQKDFMDVKYANKVHLAKIIKEHCDIEVDPNAIFDVQVKRLHEYKRQHLNLLHILTLYHRLIHDPSYDIHPRVFVFGAKAAPGYDLAKSIIHAINAAANKINNDERLNGRLKIAFLPNYSVTLAEQIIPAADVSEQISTAGKEASGTGNMKLALNGALTIGTLDGANVEIREEVGDDNIFIFGLTVEEVQALKQQGYNSWDYYHGNAELQAVIDWLSGDFFTPEEGNVLYPVRHSLLEGGDPYLVLADYAEYCKAQAELEQAYRDPKRWARMAIMNTARVGKFSTDRTMREYAKDIWNLKPLPIDD